MILLKPLVIAVILTTVSFVACDKVHSTVKFAQVAIPESKLIDPDGATVETRFNTPPGFKRTVVDGNSFGAYLRSLPMKPDGSEVKLFNGQTKARDVHAGVVDMDIGKKDLQQCADAVMRLRAEYLYKHKQYDQIHFNFTNGFRVDYTKWMEGNRIAINGNDTRWVKKAEPSNTYQDFRNYMELVFTYAGSLSLSRELKPVKVEDMQIGDVFIQGGTPGHAVIVIDMAVNEATQEKLFMLAQSYMPAQETHILKNPNDGARSPWYTASFGEQFETAEWPMFTKDNLMRFE